jgi:hypothetical protein
MFIISWVFDKLGYMPKFSIDVNHPFPATQKDYVAPDFEKPAAKKTAKKTVKIAKATTRTPKTKK